MHGSMIESFEIIHPQVHLIFSVDIYINVKNIFDTPCRKVFHTIWKVKSKKDISFLSQATLILWSTVTEVDTLYIPLIRWMWKNWHENIIIPIIVHVTYFQKHLLKLLSSWEDMDFIMLFMIGVAAIVYKEVVLWFIVRIPH